MNTKKILTALFAGAVLAGTMTASAMADTVAKIGDAEYDTVQEAVNAVASDETIVLTANIADEVVHINKDKIAFTIDGNNMTYGGQFTINVGQTVTIKNIDFVYEGTENFDFIANVGSPTGKNYNTTLTVEGCTFTGIRDYDIVAIRTIHPTLTKITGCTGTALHSMLQNTGGQKVEVDDIEITNSQSGLALGGVRASSVKNSTISVDEHCVRIDAETADAVHTIENCDLSADVPVVVRKAKATNVSLTIDEETTLESESEYDIVVTTGKEDEPYVKPEVELNLVIPESLGASVYSSHIASVDGKYYTNLAEAVEAASADNEIEITNDAVVDDTVIIDKNITINGNGYTIKGADREGDVPNVFEVISGATVTFDNVEIIGGSAVDENGELVDATVASAVVANSSEVIIMNSTLTGGSSKTTSSDCAGSAIVAVNAAKVTVSDSTLENGDYGDCPVPVIRIENDGSTLSLNNVTLNYTPFKSGASPYFYDMVGVIVGKGAKKYQAPVEMSGVIAVNGKPLEFINIVVPEGETLSFKGEIADGYLADEIKVVYVPVEQEASEEEQSDLYNIVLMTEQKVTFTTLNGDETVVIETDMTRFINRLNSADLTFAFEADSDMEYEIIASNPEIKINPANNSDDRYEFHFDGKDDGVLDTASEIIIGQVKISGYGTYSLGINGDAVDEAGDKTTYVHATEAADSVVDTFIPNGNIENGEGNLVIDAVAEGYIAVPTRNLTINVDFPNAIVDRVIAYNDMTVTVSGGDLAEAVEVELGSDAVKTVIENNDNKKEASYEASFVDGAYVVTLTNILTVNTTYTVKVEGAGYRTAPYTVTMTEDKTLNFWNNVKDNAVEVEEDKASSAKNVTFLAGDIVKDSVINIYDLSAVVSYFGEIDLSETKKPEYAKYDLNRDGKIDSKDVAYVLVSWNN